MQYTEALEAIRELGERDLNECVIHLDVLHTPNCPTAMGTSHICICTSNYNVRVEHGGTGKVQIVNSLGDVRRATR